MPEYTKEVLAAVQAASDTLSPDVRKTPMGQVGVCPDCVTHVQKFGPDLKMASEMAAARDSSDPKSVYADYIVTFHSNGHVNQ